MRGIIEDVRSALRSLRRRPGVAILAALTLAVSITGGTLMFAVSDHVMFPVAHASRYIHIRYIQVGFFGSSCDAPRFRDGSVSHPDRAR